MKQYNHGARLAQSNLSTQGHTVWHRPADLAAPVGACQPDSGATPSRIAGNYGLVCHSPARFQPRWLSNRASEAVTGGTVYRLTPKWHSPWYGTMSTEPALPDAVAMISGNLTSL